MTLENVVSTVLSVDYLFGAASALAFGKAMRGLFRSVLGRASGNASGDNTPTATAEPKE